MIVAGRIRWNIEYQGFNGQKNNRYDIEHVNSENYKAMKNRYHGDMNRTGYCIIKIHALYSFGYNWVTIQFISNTLND